MTLQIEKKKLIYDIKLTTAIQQQLYLTAVYIISRQKDHVSNINAMFFDVTIILLLYFHCHRNYFITVVVGAIRY